METTTHSNTKGENNKRIVSIAQIGLSVLFFFGYFAVLTLFLTGNIRTPPEWKEALIALLGVITGGIGTILAFWFSRSRESGQGG